MCQVFFHSFLQRNLLSPFFLAEKYSIKDRTTFFCIICIISPFSSLFFFSVERGDVGNGAHVPDKHGGLGGPGHGHALLLLLPRIRGSH